jgi:hypothetical protein
MASLPEGHVAPLPAATPPARIAAREKTPGFVGAGLPVDQKLQMREGSQGSSFTYLFPGEPQAAAFARSRGNQDNRTDACLVDGGNDESLRAAQPGTDTTQAPDWPSTYSAMLAFQFDTNPAPGSAARMVVRSKRRARSTTGGEVHAVHSERFVPGQDGHASLDIVDAWFDPRTRGARVFDRSTLPLARVLVGPNGLEVYAARDGEAVQLVVHAPDHPADDEAVADQLRLRLRNMSLTLPDRNGGGGDCGHVRIVLRAPLGAGQMATLQSTAFLPSLDGDVAHAPDGESEESRGARLFAAMRQRPFQLGMSLTNSSADAGPVLSLALGWIGRERSAVGPEG